MSLVDFKQLPDEARLWIFAGERRLAHQEVERLTESMGGFLQTWAAHRQELTTAWDLKYDQFVFIGVDQSRAAASGCSIDALVHQLRDLEQAMGVAIITTHARIFYRNEAGEVCNLPRPQFKELLQEGRVDENTIVFNNTLQRVGELRAGRWEVPMKDSWHARAFGIKSAAGVQ